MTSPELEIGPSLARPKSLSASSLLQRAGVGLLILGIGTFVSVWIFDASIRSNATDQVRIIAPSR